MFAQPFCFCDLSSVDFSVHFEIFRRKQRGREKVLYAHAERVRQLEYYAYRRAFCMIAVKILQRGNRNTGVVSQFVQADAAFVQIFVYSFCRRLSYRHDLSISTDS